MVKFDFLITGCGRSGTRYMSHLLNTNKITCGHEKYFNVGKSQKFPSESSWLATPHLDEIDSKKIIRIIRDPQYVIKSFLDIDLFNPKHINSSYIKYMQKHISGINLITNTDIENAIIYYNEWNKLFNRKIKNKTHITLSFDNLITKKNINIFDTELIISKKVINNKQKRKTKNTDIDYILDRIKNNDMYNTYELYHKIINDEHRKV